LEIALDSEPPALEPAEYGWERDERTRGAPLEVLNMIKCGSTEDPHTLFDSNVWMLSCEVVSPGKFVNRPESYDSLSCIPGDISCARKKHTWTYIGNWRKVEF
jgi:hypothetical protein